jgi:hypothetical protein
MRGHCSRSRKRPSGKPSGRAIALDDGRGPRPWLIMPSSLGDRGGRCSIVPPRVRRVET